MKNLFTAKNLAVVLATIGFIFAAANNAAAQVKDPFEKPNYEKPKTAAPVKTNVGPSGPTTSTPKKVGPQIVPAPGIEARIDYYKNVRERAAESGQPIPKVTSVLLLSEMSVMGIIKTPRGYAAMVEATPIKLSYTIYPGEKFFDGQLVAVEENRLVFRKVTKWDNGKFMASVENVPLRKYSVQQDLQGTTPDSAKYGTRTEQANNEGDNSGPIVSPLEEMNSQPPAEEKKAETAKKKKRSNKRKRN